MKRTLAVVMSAFFVVPLPAQQSGQAQQAPQVECHNLASVGNFVGPNEYVVNGQACHAVQSAKQVANSNQNGATVPTNAPAIQPPAAQPASSAEPPATNDSTATDRAPKAIVLEDGTPVHLVLDQNVSSADAVTGQTIAFETSDDVVVDGFVVIPRGSTAWATVTDAQKKRRMGRAGHVDLNIDKVRLADGEKVLLRAVKESQRGSNTGKMVGAMVATSIFTLGGSAPFLLAHGKDTTIPKGTDVMAFIQGNVTLNEAKCQRQPVADGGN